jgi:hypothetical protein
MSGPLRFSVGIPTRNQAEYLPATLDSLLQQQRRPDEIVVSDHGSTDSTPAVLADYAARYPEVIRVVQPPARANLTAQYNFTLASQTGDWITLLSSDDLALPNYAEVFVREATRRPDAALIRAPWQNIDSNGKVLGQEYLLSVPREQAAPESLRSQRHGPKVSFAAFAIRRTAFEASGPILSTMESLADWALFAQLTPFGPYVRGGELVASYRTGHDGNKFRTRFGMWVRDEQRMFGQVLPAAAERMGQRSLRQRGWIAEASRANFLRYLTAASKEFAPEERTPLLADLRPWAASVGEAAALSRFAAGEQVRERVSVSRLARRLLRPLVHRVAHTLARR